MNYSQVSFAEVSAEYKEFVDKFKPKKTTDDCYTPANVYAAVVSWCVEEYGIDPEKIVRPFWPNGDYERHEYPEGGVVLDNPPFSIITEIVRNYEERGIKYFLFAPHLTNFGIPATCHIIASATITYENGATVSTSFVTNLDGYKVRACPDLREKVLRANKDNIKTKQLPKYKYPLEVLTAARCGYYAVHGVPFCLSAADVLKVRRLDAQNGTSIFGAGFLLSEEATKERAEVERKAQADAATERTDDDGETIYWQLSAREKDIIKRLGKKEAIKW